MGAQAKQQVEVGDSVHYCFVDASAEDIFVTVVEDPSSPRLGLINRYSAIGAALLGLKVGQVREVPLEVGLRRIRVTELQKQRRT